MITLAILFTITIIGSASAATYVTRTDLALNHDNTTPGDNITLTADVDRLWWGNWENVPAGVTVTFRDLTHSTDIGSNTTNANGIAYYNYHVTSDVNIRAYVPVQSTGGHNYLYSQDDEGLDSHDTTTSLSVSQTSTTVGSPVTLSSLLREGTTNLQGRTIHFFVNGTEVGNNITASNGWAYFTYNPSIYGTQNIQAIFYGNLVPETSWLDPWDYYQGSSSVTRTLEVYQPTTVTVDNVHNHASQTVNLVARVNANGNPIGTAGNVVFRVNGSPAGTAPVINGIATMSNWIIPSLIAGNYDITADFNVTGVNYLNSTGTGILTVDPSADISVTKTVNNTRPNVGQTIRYVITVRNNGLDRANNVIVWDELPSGLQFVGLNWIDYNGIGPSNVHVDGNYTRFSWINAGGNATYYIDALVTSSASGHTITNYANKTAEDEYDPNTSNDNSSASIYVPVANITLAKEFRDPYNWDAGPITTAHYLDNVWAVIKAYNNGPDTATNVTIQDILPAGLTNTDNWYSVSYDGGLTWTPSLDGSYNFGTGNWTINSIASDAEYWLAIWTRVTTTGDKINQAAVTQLDQYYTTLETASATLHVPQEANLNLHKEFRSDYAVPESVITIANYNQSVYAILSVTNNGPDDATNININDVFTGFNYQGTYWVNYLDGWILGDTTAPFNGTDWTIPYLGNGQTIWLALAGIVEATGEDAVTNTATETAQDQYHNSTWPNATASLDVPPAADVTVTKEFRTDYQNSSSTTTTVNYHTPIWVIVHVTNAGPDAVEGLQVTDILPAGLTYQNMYHVSHDGGLTWTAADTFTAGVWNIGTMLNGADSWIAILAQVDGHNETITNIANKTQTTFDWNATNDEGNATLTVPAAADVYVNTSISKNNPTVGEEVVVRVKAGNNGPDTAQNVIVTYKIPAGMEFVSLTQEAGYPAPVYNPKTRTVTWNLGDLVVIDPWMDITLKAVSAGATSSEASVTSDTYDPVPANNVEAVTITVEQAKVNAATVPMQPTGVSFAGLILAILAVFVGLVAPKRK